MSFVRGLLRSLCLNSLGVLIPILSSLILQVIAMLLSPGSISWVFVLARVTCGQGKDRIDSSLIWIPRWPVLFILSPPWDINMGIRGWYR